MAGRPESTRSRVVGLERIGFLRAGAGVVVGEPFS